MTKAAKITITDVARHAGVAVGTVSRVLNNHPDVNPEIRDKVKKTALDIGYRRIRRRNVKQPLRGAAPSATGDIGIIFFGMEDTLVQLPVINRALQGIERTLSAQGHNLLLANIPDGNRIPPFLTEGRIKGLILKGPNQGELPSETEYELLQHAYRFPHIWLMGRLPNAQGDHCNYDTEVAGRLVAQYLHSKGHKRVAFFNPKPGQSQFEKLKQSFHLHSARLGADYLLLETEAPLRRLWPLPATTQIDNVDILVERLLKLPKTERPSALFVPSDRTAVQLDSALKKRGLRMGVDMSVVSCNNETSIIGTLSPELTTVDVHAETIGQVAVNQLLWRIANPGNTLPMQLLVEPTLVERASVVQL